MTNYELIDITKDIADGNGILNNSYYGMVADSDRTRAIDYVRKQLTKHEELAAMNAVATLVNPQAYTKFEDLDVYQLYNAIKIINQTLSAKLLGKSIDELTNGGNANG